MCLLSLVSVLSPNNTVPGLHVRAAGLYANCPLPNISEGHSGSPPAVFSPGSTSAVQRHLTLPAKKPQYVLAEDMLFHFCGYHYCLSLKRLSCV